MRVKICRRREELDRLRHIRARGCDLCTFMHAWVALGYAVADLETSRDGSKHKAFGATNGAPGR